MKERILCPNCGKLTLKINYCMFCGIELAKPEEAQVPTEEIEARKLVEQLSSLHSWRDKLTDMLLRGAIKPDVFVPIYDEYSHKIDSLNSKRLEGLQVSKQKQGNINAKIGQLKTKRELCEISDRQYIVSKLELGKELSRLRPRINLLQNSFGVRLADVPGLEVWIQNKIEVVQRDWQKLGLDKQVGDRVVEDLNESLEAARILLEEHKKIKKQIDKLEVRYKVGELKEEEYMSQKERLRKEWE